ncbi:hypothetical protein [Paraclostridium bifermentans]|uniref:hypothetical protein n=1 Tax=Paraclostridium bifermentans TaxID=1490 RepID=UPI00359CABD5
MKKLIGLIMLVFMISVTGCTNTEKTSNKEVQTSKIVYCDNCGSESKEVTKFCSNCGVEAKWVSEKPEVKENIKQESNKKEEKETKKETTNKVSKGTKQKVKESENNNEEDYRECWVCGEKDKISNLEHLHGIGYYVHVKCYENSPSCETCGNKLLGIDGDEDNICDFCEDHVCSVCGKYYEDTSELYDGVCNTCQFNEAYKDSAVCNSCSEIVDKSFIGQKCSSCGEGVYEAAVN